MNINKSKAILITLVVLISLLLVQAAFAADATTNSDSLDVMASVDESIPLTSDVSSVDEVISSSQNDANLKVQDVTNNSLATISNENILKGGDDNKIYVSTTGKDDSGDGSSSNPYATIKQALNAVTEDKNTIYVNDGIYKFSESTTISKSLINKVVTIEGQSNNVILDGQGSSYIFYIMSPTTLKNLKFTNGYSNTKGSVINIYGTSAEICNCIFVNNTVKTQSTSYGTIYSGNGYKDDIYLNIYNSTFNNNTVTTTAYYQTIYGAAVAYDLSYGKLNIENTTFKNSNLIATGSYSTYANRYGGTVYSKALTYINNCSFINSTAKMGGAVYVENKDTTLTNCDFINCTASSNSAILYNKPQQGSQAVTILAIGNTIENCSPANDLYSTNDYVTLITKNNLIKVPSNKIIFQEDSNLTINFTDIEGNPLVGYTLNVTIGDIYSNSNLVTDSEGKVYINTKDFERGKYTITVKFDGDGTYDENTFTQTIEVNFPYDYIIKMNETEVTLKYGESKEITGLFYDTDGNSYSTTLNNGYSSHYQFIYVYVDKVKVSEIKISKTEFKFDLGTLGLISAKNQYNVSFEYVCTYTYGSGYAIDGVVYGGSTFVTVPFEIPEVSEDLETIYVDSINGNDTAGNGTEANPVQSLKVAFDINAYLGGGKIVIIKSGNYTADSYKFNANITIIGEDVEKSIITPTKTGKTVFTGINGVNIVFKNITFTKIDENTGYTTIFRVDKGFNLTLIDSVFHDLKVGSDAYSGGDAAIAITSKNANVKLNNVTAYNIKGTTGSLAYLQYGNLDVINSLFYNNSVTKKGGVIDAESEQGQSIITTYLTVKNTKFINNTAKYNGGAIAVRYANATIEDSTFTENTAGGFGGAISDANDEGYRRFCDYGYLTVKDSTFTKNYAKNGGAIGIDRNNATITGNTFTSNNATEHGGAVYGGDEFTLNDLFIIILKDNKDSNCLLDNGAEEAYYFIRVNGLIEQNDYIIATDRDINTNYLRNYTVSLFDQNGNPLSGKVINITFTNTTEKTYSFTATTNEKGVASFDLSSLKVGIYSIFTQFNGDDSYNQTNKTATLKLHHYSSYFIIEPATVEMKTGSSYIITGRIYNNYEELVKDNTYEGKTIEFSYKINNKSKTFTIKVDNESKFVFDLGKLGLPASEEAYLVDIGLEIGYGNYIKGNVTVKVVANIPSNISEDLETIYVDTINGNDDTGNATEANPVKSLATALSINDYLGRGKTIFLKAGDYILFPTALDNVTIVGESTDKVKIYQKLEKQTLFTVNNTIIKFVNVSLCDATGKAQNAAAALLQITSSNATFENVKIFNNTAFQSIIRQTGGSNLTIIDSIIYDNSISSTDAIIASADSNVYVKHSTFHNNKGANGGALGFKNGTLTVEDSTFYNNSADGVNSSSDICFVGGNLTITNTTFTNGTGRYHGSIYASGTTETKKQTGGSWYNPIYTIIPGMDANVKITDSKFIKSKETYSSSGKDYGGGAIYFHTCVNAELINDTFIDNHAEAWGGAISLGNATTHIASCVFINNTANKGGSAIFRNTYKTSNSYNSQQKVAPLTIENSVLISSDTSMKTVELYYYSTNASLDNNWWGTNENPETEGLTTATVKTWIVMNLTGERNGESFDLTVTLNTTDSTGTLSPVSSEFSARKAILKGSKGTFDVTEPEVFNGVLKFTYTPNKLLDPGNVTVTVDGLSFVYVPIITETYINITLVNSTADKFTVVLNITTKNGTQAIGGTVTVVVYNRDGTVSNTFTADVTGDLIEIPIDRFTKNGDYKVTANYIGDGNEIYQSENEKTIHVSDIPKQKDKLTIKVISRTNENNKPVIVIMAIIPDDARGTVKVSVTGDEFCDMTNLTLPENLIILTDLESGNYTVDAVYNGDNNYEITVANANFTITNPVSIKSEESEANIGDEIEFTLKDVPEGATVTIFDNGVAINAKIVDNTFTYIAKTSGVHTIQITVTVDGKEQNASTTIYVAPEIIDPISIKSEESEANIGDEIEFTLKDVPEGATVTIFDNGVAINAKIVDNTFTYIAKTSGVHTIQITVTVDGKEQNASTTIYVAPEIIDPISIKSEESEANIGDEVSVTVNNIPKYATVSILDNGVTLDVELVTGAFKYLASTSGVHNITAVVLADGKEQKVSVLINVAKEGTVVVKDTGDDTKDLQAAIDKAKPGDTIILADDKTYNLADVKVNKNLTIVGGKNTKVTVVDGASSAFDIVPLSQDGPENVTIKRIEFVATKDNTTFVVAKSDDTVSGDAKLANIYINDNSVSAAPGVDASKVTLINVNTNSSSFDINKNIDLSGNKYSYGIKESIVNEGKGVPVPTIIATKFVYNDLSVKAYPNSGKFVFTLKNANGKVLTGKTVSITFNGKTFNVKTDARGAVSIVLSINTAKTYPFVAKFAGDSIYGANSFTANVKVVKNSVKIKTNTKKVKKSKSKREVKFTLKTSNDKVLAKKTVKLSINKKTYKVKTNSKGVAAFKVKLANKKKIYKYKVKFDGDKANNKKNYSGKLKVY